MTLQHNTITAHFNDSTWQALELVRLRQTPWHKKQAAFDKLKSAGLIEALPQKTLTPSLFPAPMIAVLTDVGRQALARRSALRASQQKNPGN